MKIYVNQCEPKIYSCECHLIYIYGISTVLPPSRRRGVAELWKGTGFAIHSSATPPLAENFFRPKKICYFFWGRVRAGTVRRTPLGVPPLFGAASAPGGTGGWGDPPRVSMAPLAPGLARAPGPMLTLGGSPQPAGSCPGQGAPRSRRPADGFQ